MLGVFKPWPTLKPFMHEFIASLDWKIPPLYRDILTILLYILKLHLTLKSHYL